MTCLICSSKTEFYFSKIFEGYGLGKVDYWRCTHCGFVLSKSHAEMTPEAWSRLNFEYHATYQGTETNPDDLKWLARLVKQADMLERATRIGLLGTEDRWLDYACGDGKLPNLLQDRGLNLLKYDRYMPAKADYLGDEDMVAHSFDFVLATSVFEHLTQRHHFDAIADLIAPQGVMGLHTLVREEIPADPSWFYLLPVHCAFHTNRSMQLLFRQWGYSCSVYDLESTFWLWFKEDAATILRRLNEAGDDGRAFIFKEDFVDYWK